MSLTPYISTLVASAAVAQGAALVDSYDVPTRGRGGLIVVHDITAIGVGHSFVDGAAVTFPLVVGAGANDTFQYNAAAFTLAPASYADAGTLATAVGAATKAGPIALSTLVTVTASPTVAGALRFTSVPSGVNTLVLAAGAAHDILAGLGITSGWTIAHTEAAGADASCSVVTEVYGKDETSGKFYLILAGVAQSTVSTKVLQVHPHMDSVANLVQANQLPANVRIVVTRATDDSYTRTLGIQLTAST